ncbi:hypothetical protein LSAT2_010414 [Lamellibrachia satsuma]|nr:hypothetical protein LSAT2_010414 [Lamellibrachia satsuma]
MCLSQLRQPACAGSSSYVRLRRVPSTVLFRCAAGWRQEFRGGRFLVCRDIPGVREFPRTENSVTSWRRCFHDVLAANSEERPPPVECEGHRTTGIKKTSTTRSDDARPGARSWLMQLVDNDVEPMTEETTLSLVLSQQRRIC